MFGNRAKLIYITIITLSLGFNFYQFFFPDEEYIDRSMRIRIAVIRSKSRFS